MGFYFRLRSSLPSSKRFVLSSAAHVASRSSLIRVFSFTALRVNFVVGGVRIIVCSDCWVFKNQLGEEVVVCVELDTTSMVRLKCLNSLRAQTCYPSCEQRYLTLIPKRC